MNPTSIQIISNFWLQKYPDPMPCVQINCVVNEGPFCIADTGHVPALYRYDCFA